MMCSYCGNHNGGAYVDYAKHFSFNLCFPCSKELGFIPNNLKFMSKCNSCGLYFLPKANWQNNCTGCWLKANPQKIKVQNKGGSFF